MQTTPIHIQTPLLASMLLSRFTGGQVWLKLEALQPSGSFKARGVGHACQHYVRQGAKQLLSSSGGNAGLAVAYAGRQLKVPVTVVVPQTTSARAIELIRAEQAKVVIEGASWNDAHEHAQQLATDDGAYIHPFDDPLLWQGHASLIDEVAEAGLKPDAVVLSVGGGGLLCGVIEGLNRQGWCDVPIVAVETEGAASLQAAVSAGRPVTLDAINSIATSLGAKQVAAQALTSARDNRVLCYQVSDREALDACLAFADDHRLLVEPACGAALAAVYQRAEALNDKTNVLVIVCGGVGVTRAQLQAWSQQLG
ncbi:pyridoxal-phosphate dependent enzyme [Motiliproteus sediminis]|uniref:pyridoxal-phosphate dependent enzyme n=1 Tax=Motiliproteus sediminis TaxID=1468178 RepID=UPI001AF013C5|nr:pyridoxal-phosphate dependent enzyme [Motiliproteus sediminis]